MKKVKKRLLSSMICAVLVMTIFAYNPRNIIRTQTNAANSVYDEIKKSNISEKTLSNIEEEALSDGSKAAKMVNQYRNEVDFEDAVNSALTSYYENEDFDQLDEFSSEIDKRGVKYIADYENAAKEREIGDKNGYIPGEVLVSFDKGTSKEEINEIIEAEDGECKEIIKCIDGSYLATVSISLGQTVEIAEEEYGKYSISEDTASNDIMMLSDSGASSYVNDTEVSQQYYLDAVNTVKAWDYIASVPHNKVTVAVIDTGVQMDHPDLKNILSPKSADVTTGASEPVLLKDMEIQYTKDHGTLVSGVIAAEANNNFGIAGVGSCYNNDVIEILGIQATTYSYSLDKYVFETNNFIKAINYCLENNVKVINFSAGSESYNSIYESNINRAIDAGMIFISSAGNNSEDQAHYPADLYGVISVMATTQYNVLASFTNFGLSKDIMAPGQDIHSTTIGSTTRSANGTSFSAPVVSAVAAMMCSINGTLTSFDAEKILMRTTKDIGLSNKCGSGLVDAYEAIKESVNYDPDKQNLSLNKKVVTSSDLDAEKYPATNLIDNNVNTKWVSSSEEDQTITIDLGNIYILDNVDVKYSSIVSSDYQILISDDGIEWKEAAREVLSSAITSNAPLDGQRARYVRINYLTNSTYIHINEIRVWGYPIIEETTAEQTTIKDAAPLEVVGMTAHSPAANKVDVVWGEDIERKLSGCTYNVYINGVLYLNNVVCSYYKINNIPAGKATVKVTLVLNGIESEGVETIITVKGEGTSIKETTAQIPTEEITETPSYVVTEPNIALGKTAYSSSDENDGCLANNVCDGDMGTRWSSAWTDNEWIYVDLEQNSKIGKVKIFWEGAFATQFKVQVSEDAQNWSDVLILGDTYCRDYDVEFTPVNARYVRILGVSRGTNYGYSIYELEVYGEETQTKPPEETTTEESTTPAPEIGLISEGVSANSSSTENGVFTASNVIDLDMGTRWSSVSTDNEWISLDLGTTYDVAYVNLFWETAYATQYQILVSIDGNTWECVKNVEDGRGGTEKVDINKNARFVKMQGIARATNYGYSLYEMNVYGK